MSTVERQRSSFMQNVFDSDSEAAAQLFFRLNHARQTVEFVKTQVSAAFMQVTHSAQGLRCEQRLLRSLCCCASVGILLSCPSVLLHPTCCISVLHALVGRLSCPSSAVQPLPLPEQAVR